MSERPVCCRMLAAQGRGHLCVAPRGIAELRLCLWAASQDRPGQQMAEELRPDRCHVVLGPASLDHPEMLSIHPADELAWRREPVIGWIHGVLARGAMIVVMPQRLLLRRGAV